MGMGMGMGIGMSMDMGVGVTWERASTTASIAATQITTDRYESTAR